MSRTEQRRAEKEAKKAQKTLNMTVESFENSLQVACDRERKKMSDFMVSYYSASIAIVLHDKWGFDKARLERVIGQINATYDSILEGYVSIDDIRQTLKEECELHI